MKHSTRQELAQVASEKVAPVPMQKSVVTGTRNCVFLDPGDFAFYNGGQAEIANSNSYSLGNIRKIIVEKKGRFNIQMWRNIVGHGHPPSKWGIHSADEFIADLIAYEFAYIGIGGNGGGNRLFIRSRHYVHGGIQCITLYPHDGKLLNVITIDCLQVMHRRGGWGSVTVLPPKQETGSLFWRRPAPWMREYIATFGD